MTPVAVWPCSTVSRMGDELIGASLTVTVELVDVVEPPVFCMLIRIVYVPKRA